MNWNIRLASPGDAAAIQAIHAPFCAEDSPVSFEIVVPDVAAMADRMARIQTRYPWLVCERGDPVVGDAYAGPHSDRAGDRWSVSTAISIGSAGRRLGVGRALDTAQQGILRLQGFATAFAGTTLPNPASVGLHQAMGFEPVGVYHDVGYVGGTRLDTAWWQLSLRGRMANPRTPLSVDSVRETPQWNEAIAAGLAGLRSP